MKIRFWGTRGSIPKAGPSTVRHGGNTSCIEVRSSGGTLAMVDCGTGAHGFGHALTEEFPEGPIDGHILITHTHWDHIQGFPFFAPLFRPGSTWHVYGPRGFGASLRETLSGQMQYAYFPVSLEQMVAEVHFHDLVEGEFDAGDLEITAHYLNHPALTLGYRIEADHAAVVYASDHEPHHHELGAGGAFDGSVEDTTHVAFLAGADLVIHDAQYRASEYGEKVGWGHSTIEYAVDAAIAAKAKALALHHHDPLRDDDGVEENLRMARERAAAAGSSIAIRAATEGDEVRLENEAPNARAAAAGRDAGMEPSLDPSAACILVAGCEGPAAQSIRQAAGADGIEIITADTEDAALRVAEARAPAVVFAGDALAGGDPASLSTRIRALAPPYGPSAVLVAVAKRVTPGERTAGNRAGLTAWLVGPLTPQYLRTRLRAWLLRRACRWQAAPLPPDEQDRLAALAGTGLLDTAPEPRFDNYTALAANALNAPIVLVSLVDADRQWFKSHHGIETEETPRDRSFCAHAVLTDDIMQIRDTAEDDRFADNPLVTGEPRIRFYAGVPLRAPGGQRIGTFCVIDHRPRELTASEVDQLREFARLVEVELERRSRSG